VSFSGRPHDQEYNAHIENRHFSDICGTLPRGWEPDVVIFRDPFYKPLPAGIEDSPYPTVVVLCDWFGAADYLPDNLRRFDFIFADKSSVQLLKKAGFDNGDYWPAFGFHASQFRLLPGHARTTDLFFAGSMNINIQSERLSWLRRICRLDPEYKVFIAHNIFRDEYVNALNQAKIVFNRSIKGEMNMRAFEACACGSLLFMEEENAEVRDFLIPGEECVLYNDGNLEQQLEYYLHNEPALKKIAAAGHAKIQNYTYPHLFNQLLQLIEQKNITAGAGRKRSLSYAVNHEHRNFVQTALSLNGRTEKLLPDASALLKNFSASSLILNDCAVTLVSIAENMQNNAADNTQISSRLVLQALAILKQAEHINHDHLTVVFNSARILFHAHRFSQAGTLFQKILDTHWPIAPLTVTGIVYPLHYKSPLRYLWSKAVLDSINNEQTWIQSRINTIKAFAAQCLATIMKESSPEKAYTLTCTADDYLKDQPFVLNQLSLYASHLSKPDTGDIFIRAMNANPFNTTLWKEYARFLKAGANHGAASSFILDCLLCLSRVQFSSEELVNELKKLQIDGFHD